MITAKVDEFRITLPFNWRILGLNQYYIDSVIDSVEEKLKLKELFGQRQNLLKGKDGYTDIVAWGMNEKDFIYLMYSSADLRMKFSLKFGGRALSTYLRQYESKFRTKTNVFEMIKLLDNRFSEKIDDVVEHVRLSRIDIAIDMIDENLNVNSLYHKLVNQDVIVKNKRNVKLEIQRNMGSGTSTETIYFNKRSSNSFLRIYDKRIQQITTKGIDFYTATQCKDWTRFECELKHDYAHSITEKILHCSNVHEYNDLLVQAFCDCFKFQELVGYERDKEVYEDADFYRDIKSMSSSDEKVLNSVVRRPLYELEEKYLHLFKNGTMPFFKIVRQSFGDAALDDLFEQIKKDIEKIELNEKHYRMIEQNKNTDPFFRN